MAKSFVFVCGDIGGAELQCPVILRLQSAGHSVRVIADPAGLARTVFEKRGLAVFEDGLDGADCLFVGTCGTANAIEAIAAQSWHGRKPVVLASDGFFNHGLPCWRNVQADYWCAIDEAHAAEIKAFHPDFAGRVTVTGQPAFDPLPATFARRDAIRSARRHELSLESDDRLMVWWSQGMAAVLEEDVSMAQEALTSFGAICRSERWAPRFIPMIHPKIDMIRSGYVSDIFSRVSQAARSAGVHVVSRALVPIDEICFAADLICAVTSTEEIKSSLAGGPPVIHFLGPVAERWLSEDLGRHAPYFPDIASGQSLPAYGRDSMHRVVRHAIADMPFGQGRFDHWLPPTISDAAERISRILIEAAG